MVLAGAIPAAAAVVTALLVETGLASVAMPGVPQVALKGAIFRTRAWRTSVPAPLSGTGAMTAV